jgi:hypothetical protein
LNFGAYSSRVLDWVDPARLSAIQEDLTSAISRASIDAHANDTIGITDSLDQTREIVTEKIANSDPALVYSRTYSPDQLLSHIDSQRSARATFEVVPYENRIIIPKIGKNIPLVDVDHDIGTSYTQMHEIFMEELKK